MTKIVTWNINSVRLRLDKILLLKEMVDPDIICLQETKVEDSLFPSESLAEIGYKYSYYTGEKSYNGVAILSKHPLELHSTLLLVGRSKRHISIKMDDIIIHNFYVPAGGDIPDININPKFAEKIAYVQAMQSYFQNNRSEKMILLGDLNIAPHEHDVWSHKQLKNVVSHTQIEIENLLLLQKNLNWCDIARYVFDMQQKIYSWWSYRNVDWQKSNRGRRLDHIWLTPSLSSSIKDFFILKDARNWAQPSDHVPLIVEI